MGRRRVGLFGGTFDPVHLAHVALAHAALSQLRLDHLRWIPSGQSWQKAMPQAQGGAITPATDREAMVRLAIEGESRFLLDRIEIERPGPSYMIDTVRQFDAAEPDVDWVLILGQDQYAGLHTWHAWEALLDRVTLAVADRPGARLAPDPAVRARPRLEVPLPMLDISSTAIRQAVARGADISQLVPPAVARYIDSHHLYRN